MALHHVYIYMYTRSTYPSSSSTTVLIINLRNLIELADDFLINSSFLKINPIRFGRPNLNANVSTNKLERDQILLS